MTWQRFYQTLFLFSAAVGIKDVYQYEKYKEKMGKPKKLKHFKEGIWEIENNSDMKPANDNQITDENPKSIEEQASVVSSAVASATGDEDTESDSKLMIDETSKVASEPEKQDKEKKKRKRASTKGKDEDQASTQERSRSGRAIKRKKLSPEENGAAELTADDKVIDRNDLKENEKIDQNKNENSNSANLQAGGDQLKIEEDKAKPVNKDEEVVVVSKELKAEKIKQKIAEKEKEKELRKLEKLEKKRQERLEKLKFQPVTVDLLRDIETEIIESLNIDNTDISRCLYAMSKLDILMITQTDLYNYKDLVQTLRKCRKYKGDERVRQKSDYLYCKFKSLFINGVEEVKVVIIHSLN